MVKVFLILHVTKEDSHLGFIDSEIEGDRLGLKYDLKLPLDVNQIN